MNETNMQAAPKQGKRKKWPYILGGIVVFMVIVYFSFVPVLKMIYGVHDPRLENEQSLLETANKYQVNTAAIVTVAPEDFKTMFDEYARTIPEALIFDKQGNSIAYKEEKACNAGLFSFIPALDKNGHYKLSGKTPLHTEMARLRDVQGKPLGAGYLDSAADYYVLLSWACYSGKLNKDHVDAWETLAAANKSARIQVIDVNFDMQDWWPKEYKDDVSKLYSDK